MKKIWMGSSSSHYVITGNETGHVWWKRGNKLEVTPSCKTLFVQCSGVGWLCRARQRLINMTHIHWESEGQMTTKKIYNMILMHILKNQQPKDAVYNTEHFN